MTHKSDEKIIKSLKNQCDFDFEMNGNFCTKISFFKESEIFGSTIRKNTKKNEIIKIISKLPKLKYVNIKKSRINYIPEFVSQELEYIDFSCNNLNEFPNWIIKQSSLKHLNLGANYIEYIPDISHLKIESLKLHKNKLKFIPKINKTCKLLNLYLNTEIKCFKNIENLNDIEIFSFGVSTINNMPPIFNWHKLKWLTITVTNITEINNNIGNLKSLEGLQLAKNKIKKIPDNIGNLNIKYLTLYSNQISELPDSFYNLKLNKLNLYKNNLRCKDKIINKFKNIEFFKI